MSLRFNHMFAGLMGLSAIVAFVLPARLADQYHPQLQALFAPVAWPAGRVGQWLRRRTPNIADPRPDQAIRQENAALQAELASVTQRLETLQQLNDQRIGLGRLGQYCAPVGVIGADSGIRQSLSLRGSTVQGLHDGMCVLYDGWVIGQIMRAGLAGAQVRLVTDNGSRERVAFRAIVTDASGQKHAVRRDKLQGVAEGMGRAIMVVRDLTGAEVQAAGVEVGDLVTLDEPDWPEIVQGQPIGVVAAIGRRSDAPLYAEIRVEPRTNLMRVREVMVVVKEQ